MKKRIACLLLGIVTALVLLAGCGGGKGGAAPVVGDYKLASVEVEGMSIDVDQYAEMSGQTDLEMSISIKDGGEFSMDVAGQQAEGTWEYEEPVCTLTVDGDPMDCEYADGKLTMDFDGMKMIFEK